MSTRLLELVDRLVAPGQKAAAVSASECHEIADGVHELCDQRVGAEAEDLRAGLEAIMADAPGGDGESNQEWRTALQRLLGAVDARDSLAYLEAVRAAKAESKESSAL